MSFPRDEYPYTNFHGLNLGYFIVHFRKIFSQWADLYDQMTDWKDATDEELATWKAGVESDLDQREAALRAELETWKAQTGQDIAGWEDATLAALTAWQTATQAVFEAIRVEAAGNASAAAASAGDAATAKTAAETAQAAAEAAAASVQASAAQITTNTKDIADLKTQLSDISDAVEQIVEIKHPIAINLEGYINCDISVGSVVNINPVYDAGYKCAVVECAEGDVFELNMQGGNTARPWAFVDSDKKLLEKHETSNYNYNYNGRITAPENAAFLILNQKLASGTGSAYLITGESVLSELSDTVDNLRALTSNVENDTGKIFRITTADGISSVIADTAVTVGNQNILSTPALNENQHTVSGITYKKQSDGSIEISGTSTAQITIWLNRVEKIPVGTYRLSGCPSGGGANTYRLVCGVKYVGDESASPFINDDGNSSTGTITNEISNIDCYFLIKSGVTIDAVVYPMLEFGDNPKSDYVKCDNKTIEAGREIVIDGTKTIFADSDFTITKFFPKIDSVQKELSDIQQNNINVFDINKYRLYCVHHDNFSRTMSGWEIGKNAGGTDNANNYEWVTPSTYDDGLRVDDGATFEQDNTRSKLFSFRKIATNHGKNFAIETNTPTTENGGVSLAYNFIDENNFTYLTCMKRTVGYSFSIRKVVNGSFSDYIINGNNNPFDDVAAKTFTMCFVDEWIHLLFDDRLVMSKYIGDCGTELYLYSYRNSLTHYDFINVFDVENKIIWNPNHVLDEGVSTIPLISTSANPGRYELQNNNTRWSDYADKFILQSTDPLINNGKRSERSIANLIGKTNNLRHFTVWFDVYFPSSSVDSDNADIFCQLHDRDGIYRPYVPFVLNYLNGKIKVSLSGTHVPKADSVTKYVDNYEIATLDLDKWHRIEFELKERYDENQNPFTRIYIDGDVAFESHKPNCFNDILASSPQYGIYKNLWGDGVTEFERYFDNFMIEY